MNSIPELSQDFCKVIFNHYGLFRALKNPSKEFMQGKEVVYTKFTKCIICELKTDCIICVPTRVDSTLYPVCFNCKHDLDMWCINPEEVEYCRITKESTINHFKQNSQKFTLI